MRQRHALLSHVIVRNWQRRFPIVITARSTVCVRARTVCIQHAGEADGHDTGKGVSLVSRRCATLLVAVGVR